MNTFVPLKKTILVSQKTRIVFNSPSKPFNCDRILSGKMYQRYLGKFDDDGPELSDTVPGFGAIGVNPDMNTDFATEPDEWLGRRANCWIAGSAVDTSYNAYQLPNARYPDVHAGGMGILTARSNHPGGVNVTCGDGSTRFISDTIAEDVWRGYSKKDIQ